MFDDDAAFDRNSDQLHHICLGDIGLFRQRLNAPKFRPFISVRSSDPAYTPPQYLWIMDIHLGDAQILTVKRSAYHDEFDCVLSSPGYTYPYDPQTQHTIYQLVRRTIEQRMSWYS